MAVHTNLLSRLLGTQHDRAFPARHRWLFGSFGVNTAAQFMFTSVLAVQLHRQGIAPLGIGVVMLLFLVSMRCMGPVCGALVDAYGPRACLTLSTALSVVGYGATGLAHEVWHHGASLTLLGFGRGLDAVCRSTLLVQVSATKEEGSRALAFNYVVFNLAASCGPLLSSAAIACGVPLQALHGLAALTCLTTGASLVLRFPFPARVLGPSDGRPSFRGLAGAWADRRFRSLVLVLPMIWFLFSLMHVIVPVLLMEGAGTSASAVSAMFSLNAAMVVLLGYRINRWMVRFHEERGRSKLDGVAIGAACMGLALFSLGAAAWLPNATPLLFMALFTLGELCFVPIVQVLVNESIQARGATPGPYFGLAMLAWGVGGGASNVLGGLVIELCRTYGFVLFPAVFGVTSLIVAAVFWRLSNSWTRAAGKVDAEEVRRGTAGLDGISVSTLFPCDDKRSS
ncbi:MFS transporter [Polyangium sp. 15x6]|uniref:MFS transporter n=1 Tax=Polyangium sp. 15x6 TaxID=3042687 RepID=UPI00249AE3DF|nr:MFS transporter [Polyangium sp. 15x6]MDI3289012.1 MFS transporter [Polyangium sp. 15x6]